MCRRGRTAYRHSIFSINSIKFTAGGLVEEDNNYRDDTGAELSMVIDFKDDAPSPAVFVLVNDILDKLNESELI